MKGGGGGLLTVQGVGGQGNDAPDVEGHQPVHQMGGVGGEHPGGGGGGCGSVRRREFCFCPPFQPLKVEHHLRTAGPLSALVNECRGDITAKKLQS